MPRKTPAWRLLGLLALRRFNEAAARCRGKLQPDRSLDRVNPPASMRPRPDAAENVRGDRGDPFGRGRFNEAAARCRGKRGGGPNGRRTGASFNEAAARCRGKHRPGSAPRPRPGSFNEAAARCRGKPAVAAVERARPRPLQ